MGHGCKQPHGAVQLDEQLSVVGVLLQEAVRPIELKAGTLALVDVKLGRE